MVKFLCVCQGGNVRSVGLAFLLKYGYGQDALAVSAEKNSEGTLRLLFDWADYVVLLSHEIARWLPPALLDSSKLCVVDVGPDRFGSAWHPELQRLLAPVVADWARRDWRLFEEDSAA